jgi:N-acetylneuraminate lyase
MKKHLTGLIAAPFTGINSDMSINTDIIGKYATMLKAAGVGGVFINGSTGEGIGLTVSQRKCLAEVWSENCDDDFKLIVHVGDVCIEDCMELARHSQQLKAYAIGMFAPCYYKPANVDELVSYCEKVAAAAVDTPFYYYHIPSMTGVDFLMGDYIRKAFNTIPNLAGIKYTHYDIMDYMDCCNYEDGKYDILYGRDETLLAGLAAGAEGAIGSTYNYMPGVYLEIMDAFKSGDIKKARANQLHSIALVKILGSSGNPAAVGKAIMKLCGLDLGATLPPGKTLLREQINRLETDLAGIGFFDYCIK